MTELKPCPFCGGKVSLTEVSFCLELMQFECDDCGTIFRMKDDIWNHRVYSPEVENTIEQVKPKKAIYSEKDAVMVCPDCGSCVATVGWRKDVCDCGQKIEWSK